MQALSTTDADLFASMVVPPGGNMSRESAETILKWRFPPAAHEEMRDLLQKNSDDTITPEESETLARYRRVGQFVNILQAQARLALEDDAAQP